MPQSPSPPNASHSAYKPPSQTVFSSDDDDCVEINGTTANTSECLDDLEDADVDDSRGAPSATTRRRFIIDDDEDEFGGGNENGDAVDLFEIDSTEDEIESEEENEDDLVGRALQKCARISVELKGEQFGSSGVACDRYSEVESCSVRIVTQDDVDVACGSEDSDFQPLLKPYQLVGVNFLLLVYQKGIAGGARVGVVAKPLAEFVVGILAVWFSGGVAVPLALSFPEVELMYVINISELFDDQYLQSQDIESWCKTHTKRLEFVDQVPKSLFDLIDKCLTVNPRSRIRIEEVLRHEYFAQCNDIMRKTRIIRRVLGLETSTSRAAV